jgi:damage-control phosphatase, subfamily I
MKLYPECGPCMIARTLLFCRDADEDTKYRVIKEICQIFGENFSGDLTTTQMAHLRNQTAEKILKNKDPLKDLKESSIEEAEKAYPAIKGYLDGVEGEKEKFITALKIALAGNTVEFGSENHRPDLKKLKEEILGVVKTPLAIDDADQIYKKAKKAKLILYATDNSGELVFDRLFIKELQKYAKVIVSPLTVPVQDDASLEEIRKTGIDKMAPILPRSDSIGVWFERCTPEFIKKWEEADLIIAKGMGCYETLSEYPQRTNGKVALLMKAKCSPVARDIGVPLGSAVAKLI